MLPINKMGGKREIILSFVRGFWPLGTRRGKPLKFCNFGSSLSVILI